MKIKPKLNLPKPTNNKTTDIIKQRKEIFKPLGKPPPEVDCLRLEELLAFDLLSSLVLNC